MRTPDDVASKTFKALEKWRKLSDVIGYPAGYSYFCHDCFHGKWLCGLCGGLGKWMGEREILNAII